MKKCCFHAKSVPNNIIMTYNGAYPSGIPPVSYYALSNTPINVVAIAFAQFKPQGGVNISYLIGNPALDATGITEYKNATAGIVLLSFGGGNAPIFSISVDPVTWAQNTMSELIPILTQYNLDGIDLDLEGGVADSPNHYLALINLNTALKTLGYIISMVPQCSQIYPQVGVIDNTWNTYMPLYSTAVLGNVDIIAPQFYNNCPCEYNMPICGPDETYLQWIELIQKGWTATYLIDQKQYTANFANNDLQKILIGKPGSPDAAVTGYQPPEELVAIYRDLSDLGKNLGGFMYWSSEYDAPTFTFANTLNKAFWAS